MNIDKHPFTIDITVRYAVFAFIDLRVFNGGTILQAIIDCMQLSGMPLNQDKNRTIETIEKAYQRHREKGERKIVKLLTQIQREYSEIS